MTRRNRSEIDLFKIAGVQIAIDFSWLVIFALVFVSLTTGYFPNLHPGFPWPEYFLVGLGATMLLFGSVIVHELSHAVVANQLGESVRRISLFIFGGMAHMNSEPASARNELLIAGVGPLTSLALGAIFWFVPHVFDLSTWPMWPSVFEYLGFINVALAVFNLLPGFPLDGGRILRAGLWAWSNDFVTATAKAAGWGRGIAYGLIALGAVQIFTGSLMGGLWLIFIALFLKDAAMASYQSVVLDDRLSRVRVGEIMVIQPRSIDSGISVARAVDEYFIRYGYGGFPVVECGRVVGLLSLAQVRHTPHSERARRSVRDLMRPLDSDLWTAPDATLAQAFRQMSGADSGRLLVMDNGEPVGLISRSIIARFLALAESAPSHSALREVRTEAREASFDGLRNSSW
jgi:Zn-dependent protease/CBS domain-containing protein